MKNLTVFAPLNLEENFYVKGDCSNLTVVGSSPEYLIVEVSVEIGVLRNTNFEHFGKTDEYNQTIKAQVKHGLFNHMMEEAEEEECVYSPIFLAEYEDEDLPCLVSIPY